MPWRTWILSGPGLGYYATLPSTSVLTTRAFFFQSDWQVWPFLYRLMWVGVVYFVPGQTLNRSLMHATVQLGLSLPSLFFSFCKFLLFHYTQLCIFWNVQCYTVFDFLSEALYWTVQKPICLYHFSHHVREMMYVYDVILQCDTDCTSVKGLGAICFDPFAVWWCALMET